MAPKGVWESIKPFMELSNGASFYPILASARDLVLGFKNS